MSRACFLAASSSGDKVAVELAVALGVPVALALLLDLGVAVAVAVADLVCVLTMAPLALPAVEAPCSWPSLHPAMPEQASRVKANAV